MAQAARQAIRRTVDYHRRIELARVRYLDAIEAERELFDVRFTGATFKTKLENFNRWMEQQARVVEALDEYDSAIQEYFAAKQKVMAS